MSLLAPRAPIRRSLRALRPLAWAVIALAVIVLVVATFISIYTNVLWFDSVKASSDYGRRLVTEIVMFVLFGGVTGVALGVTTWWANRLEPSTRAQGTTSRIRGWWARLSHPVRTAALAAIPVVFGLRAGFAAAAQWNLWLLWRNASAFGVTDPRFHRDDSYYVFVYPFHRYVVSGLVSILTIALISVLVIGWLRGALQIRGQGKRFSPGLQRLLSVLLGFLALVKALAYWLDRFGTVTSSRGVVTGQSYVDLHVVLPAKLALMVIALLLAVGFFFNAAFGSMRWLLAGVVTMVAAGVIAGGILPAIWQTFVVNPAQSKEEATSIGRNIQATRYGFGLDGVTYQAVPASSSQPSPKKTADDARAIVSAVQPRLLDPNVVSPTFRQYQQRESYYSFKSTLDYDRYPVHGHSVDEVLGLREMNLAGLPSKSWTNTHLVYTHGIGVVGSPGSVATDGLPSFKLSGLPDSSKADPSFQDRVYFGQKSTTYSIVGAAPGHGIEFDQPGLPSDYNYRGDGGVPVGNLWRRLVYALRFRSKNIFFSSQLNAHSQLLYRRTPAQRIQAVAPWLTLDGDIYPVAEGNAITWVADGYTTSNMLPNSQETNLRSATTTTYVKYGSTAQQPSVNVNYIRNSVVATVNAYTGAVTLYEKPGAGRDPILTTWMKAFPGLIKPASALPSGLLPHLRYPQDLFNVQRTVLAKYHVTSPTAFYNAAGFWTVPGDPTVCANSGTPTGKCSPPLQPSYYATTAVDDQNQFRLSSPLLTLNRNNIAAFLSVDCDAGAGYGQLQATLIPSTVSTESPTQLQNDIESDPNISQELTLERGGQSSVKVGNLQTMTVNGQVLAIEPIYTQAKSGKVYPILRNVVVVYGANKPAFADTFPAALSQALGVTKTIAPTSQLATEATRLLQRLQADQAAGRLAAAATVSRQLAHLISQIQAASG